MVNSHHLTPAEPDEREYWLEMAAIRPEIQDANLRLGETMWRFYHRFEVNPLLQEVFVALRFWDRNQLFLRWCELDSLSSEGEQGFEYPLFPVF